MVESFLHKPGNKYFYVIPPNTEAQKEFNKERMKDLPKEFSQKQREKLLSLKNQAERNRELSRMTDSGTSGLGSGKSSLAVLHLRKFHVRNKSNYLNSSVQTKRLDDVHHEDLNKIEKINNRKAEESIQKKERVVNKLDTLQIVSKIKEIGKINAKIVYNQLQNREEEEEEEGKRTPLSNEKISQIQFSNFYSDEKCSGLKSNSERKILTENIKPSQLVEDIEPMNSKTSENKIQKFGLEIHPTPVVDKVQG